MTHTSTLVAATTSADEIISTYQLGSTTVVAGASGTHTLRNLLTAAIEADRKRQATNAHDIAERLVYVNYGPEGDIEAFREAEAIVMLGTGEGDVDAKALLAGALSLGHLDADGILAMIREAAR
jgi:hypothetical protein